MILLLILLTAAIPSFAAVTNITVVKTTPTQAVISYTAPTADYCTVEVSESAGYSPVVQDVNSSMFTNANRDLSRVSTLTSGAGGVNRVITIGPDPTQGLQKDASGITRSRALANSTTHYFRLGCDAAHNDFGTGSFTTAIPALGTRYMTAYQVDPDTPGAYLNIDLIATCADRSQVIIDPWTGTKLKRYDVCRDQNYDNANNRTFTNVDSAPGWTNANNMLADDASYAEYTGTAQEWMYFRGVVAAWSQGLDEVSWPDALKLTLKAYCNGANCGTAANRVVELQHTCNGVAFGPSYEVTVANGSEGSVFTYGASGSTFTPGSFWGLRYCGDTADSTAVVAKDFSGEMLYNSGSSTTANFSGTGVCATLRAGTVLYVRSTEYTISSLDCAASPKTVTFTAAVDLTAPGGYTGWPFAVNNGWHKNASFGFRLRKKSTDASSNIRIQFASYDIPKSNQWLQASGGGWDRCQNLADGSGYHYCIWGNKIYSYKTTGEIHILGTNYNSTSGIVNGSRPPGITGSVLWDNSTFGRFWTEATESSGNAAVLLRCDVTQDPAVDNPWPDGTAFPTTAMACTNITPSSAGKNLTALLSTYDANYNATLYKSVTVHGLAGNRICIAMQRFNQDTWAYLAVFDIGNAGVLGSGGTGSIIAGNYLHNMGVDTTNHLTLRWGIFHTGFNVPDSNSCAFQAKHTFNNAYVGNTAFELQLNQNLSAVTHNHPSITLTVTSTWNGAWGTAPTEYAVGDPVSVCNFAECANDNSRNGDYYHGPVAAGDIIRCYDGSGNYEYFLVTARASATSLTVTRGWGNLSDSFYAPKAWSTGQTCTMHMLGWPDNPSYGPGGEAWDFLESADGTNPTSIHYQNYNGGGHQDMTNLFAVAGPEPHFYDYRGAGSGTLSTSAQVHYSTDSEWHDSARPNTFAGVTSGQPGECTESHPSTPILVGTRVLAFDAHPIKPGGPTCFNTQGPGTPYTLVSWPIFKITAANNLLHPKQYATMGSAGKYNLRNVSGPGSTITTAASDFYKVCHVLAAGECFAGSVAGETYFSAPNLDPTARYSAATFANTDSVSIGDYAYGAGAVMEYNYPASYASAPPYLARELSRVGTTAQHGVSTWNAQALPEAVHALYRTTFQRPFGLMPVVPPQWTFDGVDRGLFIEKSITISSGDVPMGTSRAAVKYWYDDSGYCSANRAEACYAVTGTLSQSDPFQWASEFTPASEGVSCASGCTVKVASIDARVLKTQPCFYNSGGTEISCGSISIDSASGGQTPTAPTITTSCPLPAGTEGVAYSQTFAATGTTPITWSIPTGSLPAGLSLNSSSGAVTGTPTTAGLASFDIRATNSAGTDTDACSITINAGGGGSPSTGRRSSGGVRVSGGVR